MNYRYLTMPTIGEQPVIIDWKEKGFTSVHETVTDKSMWKPTNNYIGARNYIASGKAQMPQDSQFTFTEKAANSNILAGINQGDDPVEVTRKMKKNREKVEKLMNEDLKKFKEKQSKNNT